MTPREAAAILRQYNQWRRYDADLDGDYMPNPKIIGEAMDIAAKYIEDNENE